MSIVIRYRNSTLERMSNYEVSPSMETLPRILFKMLGYGTQFFSPIHTILRVNVKVYERGLDFRNPSEGCGCD